MKLRRNRVDLYRRRRRLVRRAGAVHSVTVVCVPPALCFNVFEHWARQVRRITSDLGGDIRTRIRLTRRNAALMEACRTNGLQGDPRELVLDGFGVDGPRLNVFPSGRTAIQTIPLRVVVRRVVLLPAGDLGSSASGSWPVAMSGSTPEPAGPSSLVTRLQA